SAISVPLIIATLLAIFRKKHYSNSPFFLLYQAGMVSDLISIIAFHILCVFPSLGLFHRFYSSSDIFPQLFMFFSFATRTYEGFTNTLLSLNRASAILLPFRHDYVILSFFL
ncbi:hypothetical protein PFISCL1PPCAC_24098, partial [Pristionchus fissidentatus]